MIKEGKKRISITLSKRGFEDLIELVEEDEETWKHSKSDFIDHLIRWMHKEYVKRGMFNDKQA